MTIHPIDAQVMMLNQATVGKEQQQIKDLPQQLINTEIENLAKESKENETKVLQTNESEGKKIKDEDKEKNRSSSEKQRQKQKQKQKEDEERKDTEHKIDPVRGRSIDITL